MKKKIMLVAAIVILAGALTGCGQQKANEVAKVEMAKTEMVETVMAEDVLDLVENEKIENYSYFFYDAMKAGYQSVRSDVFLTKYFIFAGEKTEQEANELVAKLNMLDNVKEWAGQIYVINPMNGETYTDADKEAFIDLVGPAINNVKVIGVDDGATFVNNYVSQACYFVAGMMVYGGEMQEGLIPTDIIPTYVSNSDKLVADSYKVANKAIVGTAKDGYTVYTNADDSLQAVAVADKEETLAEAFSNAWDGVFSKNYRQHNKTAEFYMLDARRATSDFELISISNFEELGIIYNRQIDQPVTGMDGKYRWYEYVPATYETSAEKSMPLVVNLHGNLNDPRLQADTTGWPELMAKENFIMVSPEWQEGENFFHIEGLGEKGVMNLIKDLEAKYPQIDPSRIYLTGLSLGGAESFLLGAKHSDVFAAVGITSGVNVFADQIAEVTTDYSGKEMPLLYMCGDKDFFQMIPVDGSSEFGAKYLFGDPIWQHDKNVRIYSALQAYQKINGLPVTEMDMSANEYYGIALENQHMVKLGNRDMYTGTLSNENGVVMELAAIKDLAHWNYKAESEYIWNFFKNYERDTDNGKLIFK